MPLFQQTIINEYAKSLDNNLIAEKFQAYKSYFLNPEVQENIILSKEEQFQEGFLRELFVKILGYTLNPDPNYNLITEQKNEGNAQKADGAIIVDEKVIGVIELKDHKTSDLSKVEQQAFGYKSRNKNAIYVIISNFEKLRFYIDDAVEFEEFNLFDLCEEEFKKLWISLSFESIRRNIPKDLKNKSVSSENDVTLKLYKDYSKFKRILFDNICSHDENLQVADKLTLFKKSQKLLDRLLFILFAEDRGLLTPNSIRIIIDQWNKLRELDAYRPFYDRLKQYFEYLNTGYKGKDFEVFAYNGGLFKSDEILDALIIDDEVLVENTNILAEYDFASEVDVNILGHIFENSLTEIEEISNSITSGNTATPQNIGKRKKDGVFYTPQYITKYIVENTVGKICTEIKSELGICEKDYFSDSKRSDTEKRKLIDRLEEYRNRLLKLTVCDPACGSGAFLNAALGFLIDEHKLIDEMNAKVLGGGFVFREVENSILENNLFGVDINEESVEIARLSLWLRTAKPHRKLSTLSNNIKCGNSLIDDPEVAGEKAFDWKKEFPQVFENAGFDVVIGNPPYGASFNEKEKDFIKVYYKSYKYKFESYVYFIEKAISLAKANGLIEFITPQLWLTLSECIEIRKIVFLQNDFQSLVIFGENVFFDAVVNTCSFKIQKKEKSDFFFLRNNLTQGFIVSKADYIDEKTLQVYFQVNPLKKGIINKINDNSLSLGSIGEVIQGITPYDSYRGQSKETIKNRVYHQKKRLDNTYEHWLDGKDISRYSDTWSGEWLSYGTWLAAPRDPKFFEGERLLFREIPGKNKTLQVQFYTEKAYYGHSISPFKLIHNKEFNLKFLLALTNSSLLSWFGSIVLPNLCKDIFPKINPKDIGLLPIKSISLTEQQPFVDLADKMLSLNKRLQKQFANFTRLIKNNLHIEKLSIVLQNFYTLDFAAFLKEVSKLKTSDGTKAKIALKDQVEWNDAFDASKSACLELQAEIASTDAEINRLVYKLYGLTDEEIKIVEG